jgi:hypothetical protein
MSAPTRTRSLAPDVGDVAEALQRRQRRPAPQRHVVVNVLASLAGLGLGITLALAITAESAGSLSAPGGIATAVGRATGLVAAYAMVVVVLLVARIPPLERAIGQDRLVAWHRRLGPWPLYLLAGHGVFITVGYAQAAHDGVRHPRRHRRLRAADRGRGDVVQARAQADGV